MQPSKKTGVLLVNLGTPDAPTAKAVRRYLAEFLHDQRVVDLSRWIWCPVLHGVILRVRPPKVAKLYESVWTEEGSPLLAISKKQLKKLQTQLDSDNNDIVCALGMTYGNPSIRSALDELKACKKIIVLPLYPQFSSATTASVYDRVAKAQKKDWNLPAIEFIRDYHDHARYIEALKASVEREWKITGKPDVLVMSFHGIPKRYATNGDPYPEECRRTAELLAEALNLSNDEWMLTFQSIFGREEWLQPYTDKTMEKLAQEGKSVHVVCPGFAADCLETIEEINVENRGVFEENGGNNFHYIPCLNDDELHIQLLKELVS